MKKEYLKKFTKDELIEAILFHIKNEFRIDSINYFERFLINLNHKKEMLKIEEDSNKLTKAIDDLKEFDKLFKRKIWRKRNKI